MVTPPKKYVKIILIRSDIVIGPVRFAEKNNPNTVPTDLLREKNTVSVEKQAEKDGL